MIALLWRVVGVGFSLAVTVAAAVLSRAEPRLVELTSTVAGGATITFDVRTDDLTVLMLAIVGVVSTCVQVYSIGYEHTRVASYHAIVALFTAAMVTVVVADSLFLLLIGWEVMGVCSYLLIGHYWERRVARAGAVKAFMMTRFGDVGFLFGIFVIGLGAGTFRISDLDPSRIDGTLLTVGTLLLLAGVVGKSAQVPLQTWLPDAMPGPSPVSALIHAATMVAAGVFLIARLYDVFLAATGTLLVLAVVASLTMVIAALCAMAATEVKRVLAWSTVSQLAIMFGALAVGTPDGREAGLFHLLTHAAFKALLFLCAGVLLHQVGSATIAVLRRYARRGVLRHSMPVTFWTMTVGFAALAGVPAFAGFFSKDAVVAAAWERAREGHAAGWIVLVSVGLTAVLTAFYCTRLWLWIFFGTPALGGARGIFEEEQTPFDLDEPQYLLGSDPQTPEGQIELGPVRDGSSWMLVPMVLLGAGAAGLGYADGLHVDVPVAIATTVLALLGALAAYSLWQRGADPRPVVLEREFGLDALYQRTVVAPVRFAARVVVAFDDVVVGGYVRGAEVSGMLAARGFRRLQTGNVQTYLTAAVVGVVALAVLAGVIGS